MEDLPGDFPIAAASRDEDTDFGEWLIQTVRNRPRPFQTVWPDEEVKRVQRKVAQLRGTGELPAISRLLDRLLEKAEAQGVGYAHRWQR